MLEKLPSHIKGTLLPNTEGFDIGDHTPAVHNIYGGGQCRLAPLAFRKAVADIPEDIAFELSLNFWASQISRKGVKALSDRALSIEVFAMTLGTEGVTGLDGDPFNMKSLKRAAEFKNKSCKPAVMIKYKGEARTVSEWANHIGITIGCLKARMKSHGICARTFRV